MMSDCSRIAILADFPWSFLDEGASGRGGGQACTWLAQLAEEFANFPGYEFHWVTLDRSRFFGPVQRRKWRGQIFHRIPAGKLKVDLLVRYGLSRWLLMGELRRINPDIVHVWGAERAYPSVCSLVGVPTLLSMQGVLSNLLNIGFLEKGWVWRRIASHEPEFLRSVTMVTCESDWAIERVREISSFVDARQVEYGVHSSFYDVKWNPDFQDPYALFVGTVSFAKGVDLLVDAAECIADDKFTIKIAGEGPLVQELMERNIAGIELLGMLKWDALQKVMSRAACLVHPTRADSSPNVVKEARVIGLPVVTTIHGGQAGYIRDGENGFIVEPVEAVGLAEALLRIVSDPSLARRMGAVRHEEDREYFLPVNTAKKFVRIYDELIA